MASGLPLITTELGAATSVYNIDQDTGFVVNPCNITQFAEAIKYLVYNSEIRKTMGNNAYKHVRDHYSCKKMVQNYLDLYEGRKEKGLS